MNFHDGPLHDLYVDQSVAWMITYAMDGICLHREYLYREPKGVYHFTSWAFMGWMHGRGHWAFDGLVLF